LSNSNSADQTAPSLSLADSTFSNYSTPSLKTPGSTLKIDTDTTKSTSDTTFHTANNINTSSPLRQLQQDGMADTPPLPPNSQTRDVASLLTPLTNVSSNMNHVCYFTHYFIKKVSPKFYVAVVLEEEVSTSLGANSSPINYSRLNLTSFTFRRRMTSSAALRGGL
jgi:hypothetical protein